MERNPEPDRTNAQFPECQSFDCQASDSPDRATEVTGRAIAPGEATSGETTSGEGASGEGTSGEAGDRGGSRWIRAVLEPALAFWIRSQLDAIEALSVAAIASDRQLLSGRVPQASLQAIGAVYRGLHLSQAELTADDIRTNLRQVVRGKPLRLLAPVPVRLTWSIAAADLQASLESPLGRRALAEAIAPRWFPDDRRAVLLAGDGPAWRVALAAGSVALAADTADGPAIARLHPRADPAGDLILDGPHWLERPASWPVPPAPSAWPLAFGPETHLESLVLDATAIAGTVRLQVQP